MRLNLVLANSRAFIKLNGVVLVLSIATPVQALGRDHWCYAFAAKPKTLHKGNWVCVCLLVLTVLSLWDILCLQPKRETETNEDSTQTKPEYLTAFD